VISLLNRYLENVRSGGIRMIDRSFAGVSLKRSAELLAGAMRVAICARNLRQPVQATQPVRFEFEQLDLLEEAEALLDAL
jgi:hypothetical protein